MGTAARRRNDTTDSRWQRHHARVVGRHALAGRGDVNGCWALRARPPLAPRLGECGRHNVRPLSYARRAKKKKCKNEEWPAAQIYGCNCIEGGRSATIMVILSFEQNRAEKLHERCYRDAPTLFLGPWHEIYGRTISFRPEKSLGEEGMVQLNLSGHASR